MEQPPHLSELVSLRAAIRAALARADAATLHDVGIELDAAYLAIDRHVVESGGDSLLPPQPPQPPTESRGRIPRATLL